MGWLKRKLGLEGPETDPLFRLAELMVRDSVQRGARVLLFGSPASTLPTEAGQPLQSHAFEDCSGEAVNEKDVSLELWTQAQDGTWEQITPGLPRRLHLELVQQFQAHRFTHAGVRAHLRLLNHGSYAVELLPADDGAVPFAGSTLTVRDEPS